VLKRGEKDVAKKVRQARKSVVQMGNAMANASKQRVDELEGSNRDLQQVTPL
jgi:hypothetical protein